MPRGKALPQDPVVAYVERLTHDGRGIAYVDGKAVFIDQALPGETVRFGYTDIRRDYACGRVIEILSPSSQRVSPPCPHFGSCGGCSLQHLEPAAQLAFKQELLLEQLRRIGKVEPCEVWPPISGQALGYRRKARLGVHWAATRGRTQIGFRRRGSSRIAELDVCLALHPQIGERIKELANLLDNLSIRAKIPQIEVAIGDNRSALVFRILERVSEKDTQALVAFGQKFEFDIYLQPQGPDSLFLLVPENPPLPCYRLPEGVALWFSPLDFTQINAEINRRMIERAVELLEPCSEDIILDLFCGVGNFTLPLARRAGKVVG
ncbi:MAG: TRAM domain-containing protein, partial [Methylohalobius sp.]|nr:TRAM domain-containing protein [Methylohalobius sp.]